MIDVNKYNIRQLLNILRDTAIEETPVEDTNAEIQDEAIIIPIQTLRKLKSQKFYFEPDKKEKSEDQ